MMLRVTLETLVPSPAAPASPAGPDVPLTIQLTKTDASPFAFVQSARGGGMFGPPSAWSKAEARAVAQWLNDFSVGLYD